MPDQSACAVSSSSISIFWTLIWGSRVSAISFSSFSFQRARFRTTDRGQNLNIYVYIYFLHPQWVVGSHWQLKGLKEISVSGSDGDGVSNSDGLLAMAMALELSLKAPLFNSEQPAALRKFQHEITLIVQGCRQLIAEDGRNVSLYW